MICVANMVHPQVETGLEPQEEEQEEQQCIRRDLARIFTFGLGKPNRVAVRHVPEIQEGRMRR